MSEQTPTSVSLGGRRVGQYEPTRTQQLIWASQRRHVEVPLANMADRIRIRAVLDPDRFVASVDAAVRAIELMRMVIDADGGRVTILAHPPQSTEVVDVAADAADAWISDRVSTPIDATGCVYDSVLLRHADDDWTWWIDVHHVAIDAWGAARLAEAVAVAYGHDGDPADADLDELVGSSLYSERDSVPAPDGRNPDGSEDAWAADAAAAGPQPPLDLYGRRGERTTAVDRRQLATPELRAALDEALAGPYRAFSAELSLLTLAAMTTATLVRRLDGRDAVIVGVPVHHRSGPHRNDAVAPMMELYPLTVQVVDGETNAEMFRRVLRSIMGVLRRARPGESPDTPFEVVLNVTTARYQDFAGLPATREWVRSGHVEPNHVLRFQVFDRFDPGTVTDDHDGHDLVWELDINAALSADGAHHRLVDHAGSVLSAILAGPDERVGRASLLSPSDTTELAALNPEATPRVAAQPVHEQIRARLHADPDRVVAELGDRHLTARELDEGADAVAHHLVADGLTPGRPVGLRMGRGLDVLIAIQGVLRAGGRFVFLDPADPESRHEAVRADADLFTILDHLPEGDASSVEVPMVGPDDGAYILYTSGSTGLPKGVPISHRGLADYLRFAIESYTRPDSPPVVALHSSLVFDLTITSLFLGLLTDGTTLVYPADPVEALGQIAAEPRITFLKATPSQLEILARVADEPMRLRDIVVGGEAFRRPVAERMRALAAADVRIFNEYGPTEAVVGCMIHEYDPGVDTDTDVPIGYASPGAALAVLDQLGEIAAPGAWGELYVQRVGMAEGYLNRPELSAERFGPLPVRTADRAVLGGADPDGVWYRTGDRVRLERPGVLVYGGRQDDQMKVNGIRLEPAEVEAALVALQEIDTALVRVWSPADTTAAAPIERCVRCGLGTDVPNLTIDAQGVCSVCRQYEVVEPQTRAWFRTEADLDARREAASARRTGDYDCLHLLSGGKDSTYALYQLVQRGWKVHALTLDNGFISEGAKANVRRSIADLGVTHEFVTTPAMNEIFRDSLDRYANVCQGCYKTIYTLAVARAEQLGIPVIVTGLSRGQFFETRLVPHQFEEGRFDPDAIDETVLEARRVYHATEDAVTQLLPEQAVFEGGDVLDRIEFVDFFRYVDVELAQMYDFLENQAPWLRPDDTGRSTNCLINVAGISVHTRERGYHNYAEPYAWDVRLGHKTRDEALEELDDEIDMAEVGSLLGEVGYEPKTQGILTAWYQTADGNDLDPDDLRRRLRSSLPAHAVPAAFVRVDEMPLAASAKADPSLLPVPTRFHRHGGEGRVAATPTEERLTAIWGEVLGIDSVGTTDDFFDLGGASLDALAVVALVDDAFGTDLPDAAVFRARTIVELAEQVDAAERVGVRAALDADDEHSTLSPGEEAMLFDFRLAPDDTRYNVNRLYTLDGPVDLDRLAAALADVVAHHEPLHTAFDAQRSDLGAAALSITRLDPMSADAMDTFADAQRSVPFDLDAGPLVRVHISSTGPEQTSVLIGMHHIVVDAGTFDVFWRQVAARAAGETLPELATTYGDHGRIHRRRHAESTSEDFWVDRLLAAEPAGALTFPVAEGEPDGYLERSCDLVVGELQELGQTPFAVALAAVATVAATFGAGVEPSIGVTASANDRSDTRDVVGYYLNTLPLRVRADADASFATIVDRAGAEVAATLPHRTFPFASIVRAARQAGAPAPDVRVMLAYERLEQPAYPGVDARQRILASGTSVSDVTFFVQERGDELFLGIEYRGSVIDADHAATLLDAFGRVLEAGVRTPTQAAAELMAVDRAVDLEGPDLVTSEPVLRRFADLLPKRTEAIAVLDGHGRSLTFAELAQAAAGAAGAVQGAVDGRPARIGVLAARSTQLLVGLLGAQLSGAASVALDVTLPDARLDAIAGAAGLDAVLTDDPDRAARFDVPVIDLAAVEPADPAMFAELVASIDPDDDAYLIFTSGSTGVPRGVAVSHANLGASTGAREIFFDRPPARFLVSPSPGFDSSVVGLYWPLATGGTVVLPTDDEVRDVDRLAQRIADAEVTHTLMVPSLWRVLLDRSPAQLAGLETAIVAGEACPVGLVADHHDRLPGVALVNEYGPTEATVWATAAHLGPDLSDTVPIGGPIPGATVRIADRDGRAVPADVAGELLIAGPGVTAGYLDDPVATAERFVEVDGRRWYRTGDLARSNGATIDFIGRTDDQLNVGGVRLEPGDVERALDALDGVLSSVVVAAGEPAQLVAHLELAGGVELDEPAMRRQIADALPAAAVPRRFVAQPVIPRTPNGKIDRRAAAALPLPAATPVVAATDADLDPTSAAVLAEWRRLLAPSTIGLDTDFFDAGGDSLTAAALVSAVGEALGADVAVATLLAGPTPRRMLAVLGTEGDVGEVAGGVVRPVWFRRGAEGGPRIVMTPSWDDLFGYQDLADSFPADAEVVVLAYEPTSAASMITTVPELVDELEAAHDRLPPTDRPVVVLGWSIGGVAANELAARLRAKGAAVDLIALVDTFFPGEERHLWSNRWWKYKSMARPGAVPELLEELRVFIRRRVDRLRRRLGRAEPVTDDTPRLVGSFPAEAFGHRPAVAGVPLVLYRASTTNPERTVARWVTVAPDLDDVVVRGRHRGYDSIMRPDKVGAISADVVARVSRS